MQSESSGAFVVVSVIGTVRGRKGIECDSAGDSKVPFEGRSVS